MSNDTDIKQILLDEIRIIRTDLTSMRSEVHSEISDVKQHIAQLQASEAKQEKDIMAFWAERWGPLKSDIADIKNRISTLEQKDVQALERRIDALEQENASLREKASQAEKDNLSGRVVALEKGEAKQKGIAAGLGLASGGGIAALIEWIANG